MISLLLGMAYAGVADLPLQARVTCPAGAVCRIEVPDPFVAADAGGYLLLDAAGAPVPYAEIGSGEEEESWGWLALRSTEDPRILEADLGGRHPAAAVRVRFGGLLRWPFHRTYRLDTRRGSGPWVKGTPRSAGVGVVGPRVLELPVADPYATSIRIVSYDQPWHGWPRLGMAHVGVITRQLLPHREVEAAITASAPVEGGRIFELELPAAARVLGLELQVDSDVFDREVEVLRWQPGGGGGLEPAVVARYQAHRIRLAGTDIDQSRLTGLDLPARRIALRVEEGADPMLALQGATATVARRVLLVRGAGEMTLYGGAEHAAEVSELQQALPELLRLPWKEAAVGEVAANPGWRGDVVDELAAPGAPVSADAFLRRRPVQGAGWSRVALPAEVLALAREDLADVRLADPLGRQIPYVVDRRVAPQLVEGLTPVFEQTPAATRIRLDLPVEGMPLEDLTLRSTGRGFERVVIVTSLGGAGTRALREVTWRGADADESALTLRLDARGGEALLVEIRHGDNAPVPVSSVELTAPRVHLLAKLDPAGGTLLYGDRNRYRADGSTPFLGRRTRVLPEAPGLDAPVYDLRRRADRLSELDLAAGAVGAVEELAPLPKAGTGRGPVLAATAGLAVALLVMLGRLLRSAPAPTPEAGDGG